MTDFCLHIGPVKTGSTYLQNIMWKSRDALREQGVLLPAVHPNDLVDLPESEGRWAALASRARSWPDRVLITCELLGLSARCTVTGRVAARR